MAEESQTDQEDGLCKELYDAMLEDESEIRKVCLSFNLLFKERVIGRSMGEETKLPEWENNKSFYMDPKLTFGFADLESEDPSGFLIFQEHCSNHTTQDHFEFLKAMAVLKYFDALETQVDDEFRRRTLAVCVKHIIDNIEESINDASTIISEELTKSRKRTYAIYHKTMRATTEDQISSLHKELYAELLEVQEAIVIILRVLYRKHLGDEETEDEIKEVTPKTIIKKNLKNFKKIIGKETRNEEEESKWEKNDLFYILPRAILRIADLNSEPPSGFLIFHKYLISSFAGENTDFLAAMTKLKFFRDLHLNDVRSRTMAVCFTHILERKEEDYVTINISSASLKKVTKAYKRLEDFLKMVGETGVVRRGLDARSLSIKAEEKFDATKHYWH